MADRRVTWRRPGFATDHLAGWFVEVMISAGTSRTSFNPCLTQARFSWTTCSPRFPKYLRMYFQRHPNRFLIHSERAANGVTFDEDSDQDDALHALLEVWIGRDFRAIFTVSR